LLLALPEEQNVPLLEHLVSIEMFAKWKRETWTFEVRKRSFYLWMWVWGSSVWLGTSCV